jgi:TRAP-type C4-dicarboxylate transport system permease small subunit
MSRSPLPPGLTPGASLHPSAIRGSNVSAPSDNRLAGLARLLGLLSTLSLWAAGIGLVAMTGFVAWQVFCRYVLNDSPSWTEPGAVLLMSWFIFLGAAVGVRENFHLGFDVLLYVLPRSGKRVLRMISDVVIFVFGIGMVWYGSQLVALTWNTTLPSLGVTGAHDYFPVVGGGALIVLFAAERIVKRLSGMPIDDIADEIPAEVAAELDNANIPANSKA